MNAVYSYFKDPRPTRTTVAVAGLLGPGNLEITVTARKKARDVEMKTTGDYNV
jgi:enamine deaminase RidA (YjgF/YER057c/UK114 family)